MNHFDKKDNEEKTFMYVIYYLNNTSIILRVSTG